MSKTNTSKATKVKLIRPPLKLIGAKTKIRDKLYPLFPDHKSYYDVFMGTAGVLIGKEKSSYEMAGDLNEYAIRFYQNIQHSPEEFWEEFQIAYANFLTFEGAFPGEGFKQLKCAFNLHLNKGIKESVLFYLISKHSMNGIWRLNKKGECNSSFCQTVKGRGILNREWYDQIRERIKDVHFVHKDYKKTLILAELNTQDTFVYLDPPYRYKNSKTNKNGTVTTYNGLRFKDEDFREMYDILKDAKYKWMMSIGDDEWMRDLFKGFKIREIKVQYSCSQTPKGRGRKPELIITNYD